MDALIVLAGVGIAASLACSVWAVTRSVPSRTQAAVREIGEAVQGIEAAWRTERAHLASYLEQVEGLLESVERKRKSTAASASKLAGGNGEEPSFANSTPEQIRDYFTRVARSRGLL